MTDDLINRGDRSPPRLRMIAPDLNVPIRHVGIAGMVQRSAVLVSTADSLARVVPAGLVPT